MSKKITPKAVKNIPDATEKWWQGGLIYQVYIRSFCDTNGDGVGDLPGVISKLDYLADLGVDGIWLSPVTASANADWGYDVIDYNRIDPTLGTMEDFDRLIEAATIRGMRVLMDFIPNHTSIEHPWFQDALTSKQSQYRDYYIWEDPKQDGRPPSNWRSYGGGSAWEYHAPTGQYYLHNFFRGQADLNWRNEEVRREFDQIMRFWLDRGVAGFRIDVFNMLIKDSQYRDNPKATKTDGPEIRLLGQQPRFNISQPEVHEVLKRWRATTEKYEPHALLLGESTLVYDMKDLAAFYGNHDELELALNLKFVDSEFSAPAFKAVVAEVEEAISDPDWPVWAGSNHDKPRFPSRWADGDERKIRVGLLVLIALRGTSILYYGDEIGLQDVFVAPWRLKDPRGRRNWPVDGGRDRARSPMPWKNQVGAGFTDKDVRPWLPYGDLKTRSVEVEEQNPDSTLNFSRDLIALRRAETDLRRGNYTELSTIPSVWAWERGSSILVAINFSGFHHELTNIAGDILLGTVRAREGEAVDGILHLGPWEGVILRRTDQHAQT